MNNRRFVQVRKLSHIICLVKLRRVDFVDILAINLALLGTLLAMLEWNGSVGLTLPSSHCTRILPFSRSSTIQPRINAMVGSFNHTYRLPEKSFSPSIPSMTFAPGCNSSVFMNEGANVFDLVVDIFESERCRECAGPLSSIGDVTGEYD